MNTKLYNLINDPNVEFFIVGTTKLRNLITKGTHPSVMKLNKKAKAALLDKSLILPIDRRDIYSFITDKKQLDENSLFLLENAEIRVIGTPNIDVNKLKKDY